MTARFASAEENGAELAAGGGRYIPYPAYKDSGVEWLGLIPVHWDVKRLKRVATWNDEVLPDWTESGVELTYVDIGGVDARDGVVEKEYLTFESAPTRARRIVRNGDVIVSTVRTYLRAIASIVNPEPNLIVSTGFAVIRPRDIDTRFVAYAVRAPYFVDNVVASSVGVSYPAINANELVLLPVACPADGEQRAIAAFLDCETAKIDALVAKKERLIELLQENRIALITRAVTKGLNPDVPMKDSGVKWLGKIPAHWEALRLFRLTPPERKIMYGIVLPGPDVRGGVPIVKGGDVSPERLSLAQLNRTSPEIEARHVRSRLCGGDLVYAIRGSIGDVEIVPDELEGANLTQDAARVAYTAEIHGPWLLFALKSRAVFSQLEAGALGATIRGINIRDLKRAVVPLPPPTEQHAIADYLDRETAKIDALVAKVREAIDRLKELRTALISAAVTGKIDVREAAC